MDSGSKSQKSTVNNSPWKGQVPYLDTLFKQAEKLRQAGPIEYYPGQTVAPLAPGQTQALDAIQQRGMEGSPLNAASGNYLQRVLSGEFLNQENPNFGAVAGRAREAADATYSGAGRYGSGYHDRAVADSVGQLAYQDYQNQLGRMDQAAALAPTVAGQDFVDLNAALGAGNQYQQQLQSLINADMEKYNFQQQAPYANLQTFQDFIQGNYGGSTQSITPTQQASPFQQILGGGLSLLGTAGGMGWKPFG
jgi:hypothetical protein